MTLAESPPQPKAPAPAPEIVPPPAPVPHRFSLLTALPWAGFAVCALLLVVILTLNGRSRPAPAPEDVKPPADGGAPPTSVTLPEGKFRRAGIALAPAEARALAAEVGVPGKIEANPDRRVEIRPRASGVIRAVHATLGQKVKAGDLLAVLDSADVGTARLNLRKEQRALGTARIEAAWKEEVAANVARLIPELRKGVVARTIEKEYADRPLGQNRALLLQSYAEFEIASHEAEKTADLFQKKIIGEHPAFQAMHNREAAQAKFEAALEQVRYDANQLRLLATQQVRNAEASVIDAAQRLRILGVSEDIDALLAQAKAVAGDATAEDVTAYRIVAPFDGTIIAKAAVPSSKAEVNDVLFTLADLSNVWVMANVPESDFAVLPRLSADNGSIRLTATAYPGRTFDAKLLSVGALVEPTTRTVSILAQTDNPDDMLKLGMFVRIVLDSAAKETALTVPAAAVVEIDGRPGVFVPSGDDGRTFTLRPLKLGREAGDRRVVRSGLAAGQPVVAAGAFFLKSELILQNEADEE